MRASVSVSRRISGLEIGVDLAFESNRFGSGSWIWGICYRGKGMEYELHYMFW